MVGRGSGICPYRGDCGCEGFRWWWARWSKYPDGVGEGKGRARLLRVFSSRAAVSGVMGVIEGAVELPLLLIDPDMGENVSSRRRIPGLGKTTPLRGGGVGADVG